jgi:uncharacterized protein YdeI (YjbR/CyaY-like superfamily)
MAGLCTLAKRTSRSSIALWLCKNYSHEMDINPANVKAFKTPEELAEWLAAEHASAAEIWVKIFKKQTGQQSVTWEDCVVEAIAWGWIDGIKKSIDATAYAQRLTPRRANSNWSIKNRNHAEKLMANNRMQALGLKMVNLAKANGRWESAYEGQAKMQMPEDLLAALEALPAAKAFYSTLNRSNLFAIYHRLHSAKRPETRSLRLSKILSILAKHEKFQS